MDSIYIKLLIIAAAFAIGFGSAKFTADNPIEQVAEQVIKEETGLSIDFTPQQQNKK